MGNESRKFKRVVLFGIDGGGTYFEQAQTPFMDKIFKDGAISRRTLTEIPTVSAECWGAMLHGVDRHDHQLTNWTVSMQDFPNDSPYPSVFKVIRDAMPDAKLASFCDWTPINRGAIEEGIGVHKYSDRDFGLIRPALDYIKENDFTLLFFQFDSVDGAGHGFGYGTPEHYGSITTVDMYIHYITDAINARGWKDDTLVMVEADHGGIKFSHGGVTDEEKYVTFMAAGNGVCKAELHDMEVRDTSSIILHALGIEQPVGWTGRVPGGLFEDVPENLPRPKGLPRPNRVPEQPKIEEKGEFLKQFADLKPQIYLPFDEETPALAPGLEKHGKFYLIPGVAGNGLRFDDGWMSMDGPDMSESFTFMTWIRVNSMEKPVYLFSSRQPHTVKEGDVPGIHMYLDLYLRLFMNDKNGKQHAILSALPAKMVGEWVHFLVSVDKKTNKLRVWVNFNETVNYDFEEGTDLNLTGKKVYIAQDASEEYPDHIPATMDDFCLLGKVVTDEDVERLCAYYKG